MGSCRAGTYDADALTVVSGRLKLDELVSRRIKLDDVNDAFTAMEKGEVARSVIVY